MYILYMASEDSCIERKILIQGTNNRYQIKKLIKNDTDKKVKKRIVSESWNFTLGDDDQLTILNQLSNNMSHTEKNKTMLRQIKQKIRSYKQQDVLKNMWNEANFVDIENVIKKMLDSKLLCYYCKHQMFILYEVSREMKQWTIDRIDNDKGHNNDNYHLACLECNLKRRRQSDVKFLFTKQLIIVKQEL
jgi:hypothetical protein